MSTYLIKKYETKEKMDQLKQEITRKANLKQKKTRSIREKRKRRERTNSQKEKDAAATLKRVRDYRKRTAQKLTRKSASMELVKQVHATQVQKEGLDVSKPPVLLLHSSVQSK